MSELRRGLDDNLYERVGAILTSRLRGSHGSHRDGPRVLAGGREIVEVEQCSQGPGRLCEVDKLK